MTEAADESRRAPDDIVRVQSVAPMSTGEIVEMRREVYDALVRSGLLELHETVAPRAEIRAGTRAECGSRQRALVDAIEEAIRVELGGVIVVEEATHVHQIGPAVTIHASGVYRDEHVAVDVAPIDRAGENVDRP